MLQAKLANVQTKLANVPTQCKLAMLTYKTCMCQTKCAYVLTQCATCKTKFANSCKTHGANMLPKLINVRTKRAKLHNKSCTCCKPSLQTCNTKIGHSHAQNCECAELNLQPTKSATHGKTNLANLHTKCAFKKNCSVCKRQICTFANKGCTCLTDTNLCNTNSFYKCADKGCTLLVLPKPGFAMCATLSLHMCKQCRFTNLVRTCCYPSFSIVAHSNSKCTHHVLQNGELSVRMCTHILHSLQTKCAHLHKLYYMRTELQN